MRWNSPSPFDVTFVKDGIPYGYQLAESDGKKMWRVSDISLLPASMITGEASYVNYSPQRQIVTQQLDWRGGLQDLMYDDATKYYRAINTDARFKGKVILSGKNTDTNVSSNLYRKITNSHFEDWDDANTPTGWTTGGTVAKATGDDAYDGDYAVKMQHNGADGSIYQDLAFTATNKSQTFTVSARCKVTTATGLAKIGIEDKDGNTTWSDDINSTSYALISKEVTLAADATRIRIKAYTDLTGDNYLYVDDIKVSTDSGTLAKCTAMAEFEGAVYYAYGDLLFKHDSTGLGVIMEFPAAITDLCVYQNPSATGGTNPTYQRLFIAQGYDAKFWYTDDAVTFTISTVANAKYMANVGDGQFWITDSTNTMTDSDNPINAGTAFSTSYKVAGSYYEITGLVDHPDTVFARKEDQLYYLSGSSVIPLIEGLKVEANKDIDYPIYFWKDKLYIPSGVNALYEYDITNGTVEALSPVRFAIGDTRYDGKITALAGDGDYLYIAIETSARCIILSGRWETIDGSTDWRWHPIWDGTDSAEEISTMLISNAIGSKKLYIGDYLLSDKTSPTGFIDTESGWDNKTNAYDDDVGTSASALLTAYSWCDYLELTHASLSVSRISYYGADYFKDLGVIIDIDAYYDSAWNDVYQDTWEATGWHSHSLGATKDVTKARVRVYNPTATTRTLYFLELKFGGDATYYLKDIQIPTSYADPTSEVGYEIESPGDFITPWYRTAFSNLNKYFQELQVTSKVRTDGEIAVYYQLKGDGDCDTSANWTLLKRCTNQDVISGNYPEEIIDVMPIKKASERIRFKFVLSSTDDDYTPILYGEGGGIQLISRIAGKVRLIEMSLKVGVSGVNRSGGFSNKTVAQQIKDLETLDESLTPLTLTGLDGVERTVLFDAVGLREQPVVIGKLQEEWKIDCICLEAK